MANGFGSHGPPRLGVEMDTRIRLQIDLREPFADGMSFGDTGPYERIVGKVSFAVDPDAPAYSQIVDLGHGPRNSAGQVEYSTDLYILRPVELDRGNRRLIYDVNNRGNKRVLQFFNDAVHSNEPRDAAHAGNGFLMRRGYTVVWSGWQGDILPCDGRLTMKVPVAARGDGDITGVVRAEFIADSPGVTCFPLSGNDYTASYETASLDTQSAALTYREYERDPRRPVGSAEWEFSRLDEDGRPVSSTSHCYLSGGFKPGWIYELVYTAKNPLVLGLGFTGARDLISFLLHPESDDHGPPNPLRQNGVAIERAYAWGRSQSGRFLREFVYRGFNEDCRGRRVFDAISPHVAGGGRVVLNYRFAQPGRYPRQHADHVYPSDQFPFAYDVTTDRLTGKTDGILKRPDTDPLVIHTQTSSEYWERRGSLVHTDSLGNDLPDHERARVYLFSCAQHSSDPLQGPPSGQGSRSGPYRHPSNPLNTTPLLRALLDALDAWASGGTQPPDSRVPSRPGETLVPAGVDSASFPSAPGVECPVESSRLFVQDHGPEFEQGILSREPPQEDVSREYAVLVPQVDSSGSEIAGIRAPDVEAPLATYVGWNFRTNGAGKALAGLVGSYLPLARTKAERRDAGDSRPSLEERYPSPEAHVEAIAVAAQRLVDQRLLLAEDAQRYVERAAEEYAQATSPP